MSLRVPGLRHATLSWLGLPSDSNGLNSTTGAARDEVGHDDPRAALIVAEEVDVDGAAVLDERDAHAPAVGQRRRPRPPLPARGQLRGRGARDLRGRREPRARLEVHLQLDLVREALLPARPSIGGDRVGPALGPGAGHVRDHADRRARHDREREQITRTGRERRGEALHVRGRDLRLGADDLEDLRVAAAQDLQDELAPRSADGPGADRAVARDDERAPRQLGLQERARRRGARRRGVATVAALDAVRVERAAQRDVPGRERRRERASSPASPREGERADDAEDRPQRGEPRAAASRAAGGETARAGARLERRRRRASRPTPARGEARRLRPGPASSAATKLVASANRSPGSFARPRSSTASTTGGSSGRRSLAGGTGASTCANRIAASVRRGNGTSPVSSS